MTRGLLISIEGGEGAGKSALSKALLAHFDVRGLRVRAVREPGGTRIGERIREVLLYGRELSLTPETEALLFSAARAQLTQEVVRPALYSGTHVVADRFFDSTLAYQGYGHGVDLDRLRAMTRLAVGELVPDITFLLDLSVEQARSRTGKRAPTWDRFESRDEDFHERVRQGYLRLAREEPKRWIVLDASMPETKLAQLVAARVDEELARHSNRIPTRQ